MPEGVYLGIAAKDTSWSQFWADTAVKWAFMGKLKPATFGRSITNRVDINRSALITGCKKATKDLGMPLWLCMVDTDVVPQVPFDFCIQAVQEARARGFDLIASPTTKAHFDVSHTKLQGVSLMVRPTKGAPPASEWIMGPNEVEAIAFGLVYLSPNLIDALEPADLSCPECGAVVETAAAGSTDGKITRYCRWGHTSEDYDLCDRVRALGFKVAADPRLFVHHWKMLPQESYVPPSGREASPPEEGTREGTASPPSDPTAGRS